MEVIRLRADSFLQLRSGWASVISDPEQLAVLHCHDYYEIFVVSQGTALHTINGINQRLEPGMLYFMRPDDIHAYLAPSPQFQVVNIIIPSSVFLLFLDYVGDSYYRQRLLSPVLPPHTTLAHNELESLMETMKQLLAQGRIMKSESDTLFRIAVFNLLTTYFPVLPRKNTMPIPDWIRVVNIEMMKKPNFTEGLPALYRIAGKTPEHISRACRKYLNKTPSQLVNDIRLEYAARCLLQSETEIVEICADVGFDSLSHFYHLFRNHFGISPSQFRKHAMEISLPDHILGSFDQQDSHLEAAVPLRSVINMNAGGQQQTGGPSPQG